MRVIKIILCVVILGPFVAMAGLQGIVGYYMFSTARSVNASVNPEPYRGTLDMTNHLSSRGQARSSYLSVLEPGKMKGLRSLTLSRQVPMEEFLKPGETLPAAGFREVFANARAATYAKRECDALNRTLTRSCDVLSTDVDLSRDGRSVRLRATYDFVQAPAFGGFDRTAPLRYESISRRLTEPVGASSPEARERAYRKIAGLCDDVRQNLGMCGITRVELNEKGSGPDATLHGRVHVGVIQPRS